MGQRKSNWVKLIQVDTIIQWLKEGRFRFRLKVKTQSKPTPKKTKVAGISKTLVEDFSGTFLETSSQKYQI